MSPPPRRLLAVAAVWVALVLTATAAAGLGWRMAEGHCGLTPDDEPHHPGWRHDDWSVSLALDGYSCVYSRSTPAEERLRLGWPPF